MLGMLNLLDIVRMEGLSQKETVRKFEIFASKRKLGGDGTWDENEPEYYCESIPRVKKAQLVVRGRCQLS